MKRDVDMKEISDGKRYHANDMVKADCGGCVGCCDCCQKMGNSIVLDPMDAFRLEVNLHMTFEELLQKYLELNMVDGIILPNLQMKGQEECCAFLNEEGRCSIHEFRPGSCRLFPLGRIYEGGGFAYFLQVPECPQSKTKIKIKKWLEIPELNRYEAYILSWHQLLKKIEKSIAVSSDENWRKSVTMLLLNTFYVAAYEEDRDFYSQFEERRMTMEKLL